LTSKQAYRIRINCESTGASYILLPGDTFNFSHTLSLKIPQSWEGVFVGADKFKRQAFTIKTEPVFMPLGSDVRPQDGATVTFERESEIVIYERPQTKPCCFQTPPEPEGGRIVDL
jgi:hypothetical protein